MPIGSTTSGVNMVNVTFTDANGSDSYNFAWQSTSQMIPMGINGDPAVQLDRLKATLPHVNNLRLLFNEYSFNADGSLHAEYESFLAAATAEGYDITFVYAGGDAQNIGLNGWVKNAGTDIIPTGDDQGKPGKFWPGLTNAQAWSQLQAQFQDTRGAWVKMMNWLDDHPATKSAVYGFDLMNEAAGYKHSISKNGTGGGYDLASFVKLYADHNIALSNLIQGRADGKILVGGWGYNGDFETLDTTLVNGVSALDYIRAGIGGDLVWSAHLYPGWAGTDAAEDPVALASLLNTHFAPLSGDDVIVTETNAGGEVDDPAALDDVVDLFVASYEWFADNGIGIGWFPFNSTGGSSFIWFEGNGLQVRHQHSLAHAMNAYSLDENPAQHAGNQSITASTIAVKLRNETYQTTGTAPEPTFDTSGRIGWGFGYAGNDTLTGTDTSNDFLYGGTGSDNLRGLGSDDFLFGQDGNDTLTGTGNDYLFGGRGDDRLISTGAADVMRGGLGNDTFVIDSSSDKIREFANGGTDTLQTANLTSQSLASLTTVEYLTYTGSAAFTGTGNGVANRIASGAGNDTLSGAAGNDTLQGGAGGDSLDGSSGSDWASYASATEAVNADLIAGRSALRGDALGDTYVSIENLLGGTGHDTLRGDDNANQLSGGAGDDRFWARGGNDTLTGGAGADVFNFERGYAGDRIQDFQNDVDSITFSKMGFTSVAQAMGFASQSGANVVFSFGNGDSLTVVNTTLAALQNDILLA